MKKTVFSMAIALCTAFAHAGVGVPLYGTITGENAVDTARKILEAGKLPGDPFYLVINSNGGEITGGALIIDAMLASKRPVYTICVSFCASMAAWIHQAGMKRYMFPHALLMFHQASMGLEDSVPRVATRVEAVEKLTRQFEEIVALRTGLTVEDIQRKEANQWWVYADEAKEQKLADGILVSSLPQ